MTRLHTTLNLLRDHGFNHVQYEILRAELGEDYGDDTLITPLQILHINGARAMAYALPAMTDEEKALRLNERLRKDFAEHVKYDPNGKVSPALSEVILKHADITLAWLDKEATEEQLRESINNMLNIQWDEELEWQNAHVLEILLNEDF